MVEGLQKLTVKIYISTGSWLEPTIIYHCCYEMNQQWCCGVTAGFWLQTALIDHNTKTPSSSSLSPISSTLIHQRRVFPTPFIVVAVLHQNVE
jgi:hypothetical protein